MKSFFKNIYRIIPFKKQFFILIRFFWIPPKRISKHLHFNAAFTLKLDNEKSIKIYSAGFVEENELFWEGIENAWEKKSIELWRKMTKDANIIIDVGANTGLYSLVAKAENPSAQVIAFEPLEEVMAYLKKNNALNNFDIQYHTKALSYYNGKAKVYLKKGEDFAYSVTVNKSLLSNNTPQREEEIDCLRLDSFIEEKKIPHIDLMKIDVETHEAEVLEGMGKYLEEYRPDMIIEIWDKDVAKKLNTIFSNLDYLYFDIDDKNDKIIQRETIIPSMYWNYLICKRKTAQKLGLIK